MFVMAQCMGMMSWRFGYGSCALWGDLEEDLCSLGWKCRIAGILTTKCIEFVKRMGFLAMRTLFFMHREVYKGCGVYWGGVENIFDVLTIVMFMFGFGFGSILVQFL